MVFSLKFSTKPGIVRIRLQLPWWGPYWGVNLYRVFQGKRHQSSFLSMSLFGQFAPSQPISCLCKLGIMLSQRLLLIRSRHMNSFIAFSCSLLSSSDEFPSLCSECKIGNLSCNFEQQKNVTTFEA